MYVELEEHARKRQKGTGGDNSAGMSWYCSLINGASASASASAVTASDCGVYFPRPGGWSHSIVSQLFHLLPFRITVPVFGWFQLSVQPTCTGK